MLTSNCRHGAVGLLVLAALCGPARAQETPINPTSVAVGSDGTIYGISGQAGDRAKLVFKLTSSGPVSVHAFHVPSPGTLTPSRLMQGPDGQLYLTLLAEDHLSLDSILRATSAIYRLTLDGGLTAFSGTGVQVFFQTQGPFVPATDSNLYFVLGGFSSTLYRRAPNGTLSVLHGNSATSSLVQGLDGALYGLDAGSGGQVLFRLALDGTYTPLQTIADGSSSPGRLIAGADGNLYGVDAASIFRATPSGVVTTLHTFDPSAGDPPLSGVVQAADGSFLGVVVGTGGDRLVRVASDGTASTVHTFIEHEHVSLAAGPTGVYGAFPQSDSRPNGAVFVVADGTYSIVQEFGPTLTGADVPLVGDIDGDGKADLVAWRPSTGTWFWLTSSSGYDSARSAARQWGDVTLGDVPLLADMDGDGKADLVVWRASTGTWWWLKSSTGFNTGDSRQWGNQSLGDVPRLADMDGDGKADLVLWRASTGTWFWLPSSSGYSYATQQQTQWGNAALGDVPFVGDLDDDGRGELIVWRASTGTWFWLHSTSGYAYDTQQQLQWGSAPLGDVPFIADLDGDHLIDLTVWRASTGTWHWLPSSGSLAYSAAQSAQWGNAALGDIPLLPDIDGDGHADLTVWRASTGTWYWLTSASGYAYPLARSTSWGAPTR